MIVADRRVLGKTFDPGEILRDKNAFCDADKLELVDLPYISKNKSYIELIKHYVEHYIINSYCILQGA